MNYLQDKDFLFALDNVTNKVKHLKMIMLSFDEKPISEIQGRALSGNVSCSGQSAIRRTCSFQLGLRIEESSNKLILENYLSIDKKFQLWVGYENPLAEYAHYGDIIWFNLGVYIINSYSLSYSNSGVSASISAQDKMSQLDGSIGGVLPAPVVFHERYIYGETEDDITIEHPTLVQIIREAVNHFGNESLDKILINDLEETVKVLVEYRGDAPIYFNADYSQFRFAPEALFIHKYEYGDAIGYRLEDFTYPGELILGAGDTVVTLLDKIKTLLGNFEYFYDLNGNFIFQEIKNYLNTSYTPIIELTNDTYFKYFYETQTIYSFRSSAIINSISKNPSIGNIKNDFICWGTRKSVTGANEIGIRYHLAIDKKPIVPINEDIDWREVIYRQIKEDQKNGTSTSYYNYYSAEMLSEWRNLYCPYTETNLEKFVTEEEAELAKEWKKIWIEYFPNIEWKGWNPSILKAPQSLNFYIDFIDSNAEVGKYSVANIGRRSQVINDTTVTSIYTVKVPDIVFARSDQTDYINSLKKMGYKVVAILEEQEELFGISSQGKSCYDVIRQMLYQNLSIQESVNISCFPIYYLEPNNLIEINEPIADVYGNYLLQSFTLPLEFSGNMSISAIKAEVRV